MLQGDNETSFALFWTKVVLLFYLGNITFLKSIKYLILSNMLEPILSVHLFKLVEWMV